MGRKAGCRFQISIINEETNNAFVPLTVNLPERYQLSAGEESRRTLQFPLTHQLWCLFLENTLPKQISIHGNVLVAACNYSR